MSIDMKFFAVEILNLIHSARFIVTEFRAVNQIYLSGNF